MTRDAIFAELAIADGTARAVVRPGHVEDLCEGHFPGAPIVPGAHLTHLMAELAGMLLAPGVLLEIERSTFLARVTPDDPVTVTAARDGDGRALAEVHTRGVCAARARLRFAP